MELALRNAPNLKYIYVKAEFCTENFDGRDTSFTLKGLIANGKLNGIYFAFMKRKIIL